MSDNLWDDPEMKVNDQYVSFEKAGDEVTGTVLLVKKHTFNDGSVAPQILLRLDNGDEKTLTGGAIRLKAELAEKRPMDGDRLTVRLDREEPRGGGKTLRHWVVEVQRGNGTSAPVAAAPAAAPSAAQTSTPAAPAGVDPAALAALQNLSDEEKKALGLLAG